MKDKKLEQRVEVNLCLCGCGNRCKNKYVKNHNIRFIGHGKLSEETKRRISIAHKSKPLTEKQLKAIRLLVANRVILKGKDCSWWKGGISRHYYERLCRDKLPYTCCQICGSKRYLVIHHINGNRADNNIRNLCRICTRCHNSIHINYANDRRCKRGKYGKIIKK